VTKANTLQYSSDPFTRNYGADKIRSMLQGRYGQRYLDYRADWERAGVNWLPEFPLNLVFDLVDKCNLACPQCLRAPDLIKDYGGFIGTKKFLAYDVIARILDEARGYRLPSVNIGGSGECTMHPDFVRICEKVMDIDVCEFRIISNGIKLKGDVAAALIDLGVHMVSVSIDSFSPDTFVQTRGKARFYQEVVDNVVAFAEERRRRGAEWPLLRVSFVEQQCNRHETEDFIRFWSDHADMIDVQVYHDFRMTGGYLEQFDCFEPYKRLTMWAYGGAGPCCGFPGIVYNVGDFSSCTIKHIWNGPEMASVREMVASKAWQQPCLQCQGTRTVV
jgi:hypothetical protein